MQKPAPGLRSRFRGCRPSGRFVILVTEHERRDITIATAWFPRSPALRADRLSAVTLTKVLETISGNLAQITCLDPPLAATLAVFTWSTVKGHDCFDAMHSCRLTLTRDKRGKRIVAASVRSTRGSRLDADPCRRLPWTNASSDWHRTAPRSRGSAFPNRVFVSCILEDGVCGSISSKVSTCVEFRCCGLAFGKIPGLRFIGAYREKSLSGMSGLADSWFHGRQRILTPFKGVLGFKK